MNSNITALVRQNIQSLVPYASARDEYKGNEGVFLDANENPFGLTNRYPDPYQKELKQVIADIKNIDAANLFLGNGSDEAIDLAYRIFCEPKQDKALAFTPTYGMYEVYANINNVDLYTLPLNDLFQIDKASLTPYLQDNSVKLMFICSPNNPTGNVIATETIEWILANFKGIVIVDEAYIDFSNSVSWTQRLGDYPNLIILQTLSKGWGMAGLRIGMAVMNQEVLQYFNKVKSPYNISQINQMEAIKVLSDTTAFDQRIALLNQEKARVIEELNAMAMTKRIYPSDANFILVEVTNANAVYSQLIDKQIIVRNRHSVVPNTLRISIGTPTENTQLINTLKQIDNEKESIIYR